METKEKYIKPEIEVIEVEFEDVIAQSSGGNSFEIGGGEEVNNPRSGFWDRD